MPTVQINQQDAVNAIIDPIERRKAQASLNRLKKITQGLDPTVLEQHPFQNIVDSLTPPGEIFDESIEIVEKTELSSINNLNPSADQLDQFENNKKELTQALRVLKSRAIADLRSKRMTQNQAEALEEATRRLVITGDLDTFKNTTNQFKPIQQDPLWQKIMATLMGAIVGFFAGITISIVAGARSRAASALVGGATGAGAGYALDLLSFFKRAPEKEPLERVAHSASEVFIKDATLNLNP